MIYVTEPTKIDHLSTKNCQSFLSLLYHNLITIYTTTTVFITTINYNGFFPQLTEKDAAF